MKRTLTMLVAAFATAAVTIAAMSLGGGSASPPAAAPAVVPERAVKDLIPIVSGFDKVYRSIAPCRIVDTREGGGILAANQYRNFLVAGDSGFTRQKHGDSGCGIPTTASAIAITVTSVGSSGNGRLVAYPATGVAPNATTLSYYGDRKATASSIVDIPVGQRAQLRVMNFQYKTHLVVDVTGYFESQIAASVDASGAFIGHSDQVLASSRTATGRYHLTFGTDIDACVLQVSPGNGVSLVTATASGRTADVVVRTLAGAYVNREFNVTAAC